MKPTSAAVTGRDAINRSRHYEDQIAELKQQLVNDKLRAAVELANAKLEAVENEMECKKQIENQRKEILAFQEEVGALRKQQAGPDGAAENGQKAEI